MFMGGLGVYFLMERGLEFRSDLGEQKVGVCFANGTGANGLSVSWNLCQVN